MHSKSVNPQHHADQRGFTLLELLIALSIFAMLSVMAFAGLKHLVSQHQRLQVKQQDFANLQTAVQVLERDLTQILPRTRRDALGDMQAALSGSSAPQFTYALTTQIWFNPHSPQGNLLQRVGYQWQDQQLWRSYEPTLDAGLGSQPVRYALLDQVTGFKLLFLSTNNRWIDYWPPINNTDTSNLQQLPKAIELILTTSNHGRIRRLLAIPQAKGEI